MGASDFSNIKLIKRGLRHFLSIVAVFFLLVAPLATPARADIYDDRIKALQQEIEGYQSEANGLKQQADSLQNAISALSAQQSALRVQIAQKEVELEQLKQKIEETEARIANQKSAMAQNLRSMYIEGDVTPLEVVASSKSISEFVDKQEYRNKIRDSITRSLETVKTLKEQLNKQQKEVEHAIADQKAMNNQLAVQQAQKDQLLAETQGQEAAYQDLVKQKNQEIANVQAQQRAAFAQRFGTGFHASGKYGNLEYKNLTPNVPCGGGYPSSLCAYMQDSLVDEWDLYNRECVSYVAWALAYRLNKNNPILNSSDSGVRGFNGQGNAESWPGYVNGRYGTVVTENAASGAVPGAAVVIPSTMIGGVGHVVLIESVSGEWMHVSQYNWAPVDGKYSEMDLKIVPGLIYIHF